MQFKLPELGEGVHEGELVKWRVQKGEAVKFDQPICEIMTDKATVEIPSPFQGKVADIHVKEGQVVHVGQLMLSFEGSVAEGASASANGHAAVHTSAPVASAPAKAPAAAPAMAAAAPETHIGNRVLAAPSTRRVAREMGVDLHTVTGTGEHGRVMRSDVESAARGGVSSSVAKSPVARIPVGTREERVPFKGLRKKISEKMRQSKDHAAHFTYVEECDRC